MAIEISEHSKIPDPNNVTCQYCGKEIAKFVNDEMVPGPVICYKNGNIPVPNFGWLCSFECAENFEKEHNVKFMRTVDGRIDYYEGEFN